MLKETETEETRLFCHIPIIDGILIGEGGEPPVPPLASPMGRIYIVRGSWHVGDFCNIFLPSIDEDKKKSYD